jgi:cell division protein FtsA
MLSPLIGLSRFELSGFFSSAMARGKPTSNLFTEVDIGTSKVCVLIAEIAPEGGIVVLGHGITPCSGLCRGIVVNIEATVEALRMAISEAQKSAGVEVGVAAVGISGAHIHGLNSHGIVAVHGGEVGPCDIRG